MNRKILFIILAIVSADPAAKTIVVATIQELVAANTSAAEGDTISLRDGSYRISSYGIAVRTNGLCFKSESGVRENVIVMGAGTQGDIEYGFWVSANRVTIRDVTIKDVYYHCIQTNVNVDSLRVFNCVLKDGREQLLKVPSSDEVTDPSEGGVVEGCLFEFSKGVADQYYTGGVDCHLAKNWIIRNNVFKNIRSPDNQVAEHAVHFWSNSEGTVVECNTIINCDRGIGFGLGDSPHKGGIIRNNMIYHAAYSGPDNGDVGIGLESCAGTRVYSNTIFFENNYADAIEFRFAASTDILIVNNLSNKAIKQRDGASATVNNNVTSAQAGWFKSASTGDLHLAAAATGAIDKGVAVDGLTGDIDLQARPASGIDVGADEYYGSGVRDLARQCIGKKDNGVRGGLLQSGAKMTLAGRRAGIGACYGSLARGIFFEKGSDNASLKTLHLY
jgi:hypothetical protein